MNTREQAILYWLLILLILVIVFGRKNNLLDSVRDIIKYTIKFLLNPIALVMIVINLIYLIIMYYFVYKDNLHISLWYIKDYLIVLFFSVFPIVEYLKKLKFRELIREKKTELSSLATIPLFLNSTYTLSVFWEMILILIITILSVLIAIANQKEDTKIVAKFFNFFLISIGLFMLVTALNQFLKNINDVFSLDFWLSFGIEPLVWALNLPVIYLVREMIFIEKKVIFSQYKNRVYSYIRYCAKLLARKSKFRKYEHFNSDLSNYIQEAKELSAVGGNRIYIKLNKKDLPIEILIAITSDAILGRNKFTDVNNQREKYPNVVEIINVDNELCVFWQDNFVSTNYRDTRIDKMKSIELIEEIKLIQK
ncbi:hypothetical protein EGW35_12205 [Enterococcus durans]|uniref:hypothetical protein n=3 Tax=Enterococcus durans TaxID=53345 RepID=UPI000F50057D|nr:hypothetical protein [Enterococcus durans]ROX80527.1 hypothetical protein EGW35_12205 [Enterococcus durans]